MAVSSLYGATGATGTTGAGAAAQPFVPGGQLGQNAFLQLLSTQLQYQDPLNPPSNTQFVSQLAQFSALEQMTNVAAGEGQVSSGVQQLIGETAVSAALNLLGATATVSSGAGGGSQVTGTVSSVGTQNGQVTLTVNGASYPLSALISASK